MGIEALLLPPSLPPSGPPSPTPSSQSHLFQMQIRLSDLSTWNIHWHLEWCSSPPPPPSVFVTASKMHQMSIWQINSFTITVNVYSVPTVCLVIHLLLWLQNTEGICKADCYLQVIQSSYQGNNFLSTYCVPGVWWQNTSKVPFSSWILSSHRLSLRLPIFPQLFLCCFMYSGYSIGIMSRLTLCMLAWQHFCCQDR